ncbi:MAG: hypothetical protein IPJ27_17890 [Candidatus Accumulibacter sp.]|uniref:Nucleotidyltransferase n=1 Tax=Candidatus Accumulibacter proximus TaxID=2954385 RepID=A0A935Q1S5_9PROT|nr:hypothetical protein [Candidatus Accumulibacter proximus]
MSSRQDRQRSSQRRSRIAALAARLMAEDGIGDLGLAKRKAARNLGLPEGAAMPEDSEVEVELRTYQRLFQDREQQARHQHLLRTAARLMATMQHFNPYLTGSVLDGTAGRYAEIDIQLFPDSAPGQIFHNSTSRIDYRHSLPRTDQAEVVLAILNDDTVAQPRRLPRDQERQHRKRDGPALRERGLACRPSARLLAAGLYRGR